LTDYLEDHLDLPLRTVLPMIQQGIMSRTSYFGIKTFKSPMDAWVYQEIIFETKPDVIVEIGNANGGSTLFLAHLCSLLGKGRVIGIDLSHKTVPTLVREHPRISLIEGDACGSFEHVEELISKDERVLVIEDSSHAYANTLRVLRAYSKLVRPGDYFIVEDSINRHGIAGGRPSGPYEAIEDFIRENTDFEIDRSREHFFITWNPKGFLRRRGSGSDLLCAERPRETFSVRRTKFLEVMKLFVPPIAELILAKLYERLRS
jgi:cephalosporin hydroxylase